jgi:DNA polymerase-3 subunit beta
VILEADGTKLHIKSGSYQSTIHGMAPDEFPALPDIIGQETITVPVATMKRAIQQTVVVTSGDDTRPVLTGVYCHTHDGNLYFAATDGYRLAERLIGKVEQTIDAIIPSQTLQDVLRVVTDDSNDIVMIFDENQVRILVDDIEITSRLIDGTFPDYRQLVPATTDIEVTVAKDEFARITKIASLFARESGGSVTLNAMQEEQKLSIHSIASQLGENTSEAEAEVTADGQVTLNSRYLLEALGCIDSPKLQFSFSGKLSPCVLTTAEKTRDYKHIIMPLKS